MRQGFLLVNYNKHGGTFDTAELLEALGLTEYAKGKDGFSAASETAKYVFIHSRLSEDELVYVLLHELGHILCEQPTPKDALLYSTALNEKQAHEFAMCVLKYTKRKPIKRIAALAVACLLLTCIGLFATPRPSATDKAVPAIKLAPVVSTGNTEQAVFVTRTGKAYHRADCYHIEGRPEITEKTFEQAHEAGFFPCKICRPDNIN